MLQPVHADARQARVVGVGVESSQEGLLADGPADRVDEQPADRVLPGWADQQPCLPLRLTVAAQYLDADRVLGQGPLPRRRQHRQAPLPITAEVVEWSTCIEQINLEDVATARP